MRNLKMATRLSLAFSLLLGLMVVAVALALVALRQAQQQTERLEGSTLALLDAVNTMRVAQLNEAVAIRDFVGQANVDRQRAANEALRASEKAYAEAGARLARLAGELGADARMRALVGKLQKANAPIDARLREAMDLSDQAEYPQAQAVVYDTVRPLQAAVAADLQSLADAARTLGAERAEQAREAAGRTQWRLAAMLLLALAVGALATVLITRGIVRPLRSAVDATEKVAEGDLRQLGLAARNDEAGRVLAALASMQGRLNTLVRAIRDSSVAVGRASDRISHGNTELAARTEQQAAALEETAASVEELTAIVKQNSESASRARDLAREASALAEASGQDVGGVVRTMEGIHQSSRKVSDIVGVIDGIAFQTNLLALNAAVEAARAGDQGRGFGVVAAQVRELARRSADASRDIKKLVNAALGEAQQGSQAAGRAGDSMGKVVRVAHQLSQLVTDIARASEEQRAGIEQVNTTIAQMDTSTQSNAALVQEINGFIDALLAQARELQEATRRFRLEDGQADAPLGLQGLPVPV